jgi:protein phosphatase 2C family protein 2/3
MKQSKESEKSCRMKGSNIHPFNDTKLMKSKSLLFANNKKDDGKYNNGFNIKTQRNLSSNMNERICYPKIMKPQIQVNIINSNFNCSCNSNNSNNGNSNSNGMRVSKKQNSQQLLNNISRKLKNKSRNQFRMMLPIHQANSAFINKTNNNINKKHFLTYSSSTNNNNTNSTTTTNKSTKYHINTETNTTNDNYTSNKSSVVLTTVNNNNNYNYNFLTSSTTSSSSTSTSTSPPPFKILSNTSSYQHQYPFKHHKCLSESNHIPKKPNNISSYLSSKNLKPFTNPQTTRSKPKTNTNTIYSYSKPSLSSEEQKNQTPFLSSSFPKHKSPSYSSSTLSTPSKPPPFNKSLYSSIPNFKYATFSTLNEFISPKQLPTYITAYAYNTHQGTIRNYNEDTIQVTKIINGTTYYFGLYDGHGGNQCSSYLKQCLHTYINHFSIQCVKTAISIADTTFLDSIAVNHHNKDIVNYSGSCACGVIVNGTQCIVFNVGDSKCLIVRNWKVHYETKEHKPNETNERQRITNNGGHVYQSVFPFPIYQNGKELEPPFRVTPGNLSVSRTIGDVRAKIERFGGKKGVVVSAPDVNVVNLDDKCNAIVICCDGVFDVMDNNDIVSCVIKAKEGKGEWDSNIICAEAANLIIKMAIEKESFDNVSCIVIGLNLWSD